VTKTGINTLGRNRKFGLMAVTENLVSAEYFAAFFDYSVSIAEYYHVLKFYTKKSMFSAILMLISSKHDDSVKKPVKRKKTHSFNL
jgi:hypothetical protein